MYRYGGGEDEALRISAYTVDFITFFRRAKSFYVATLWSIMPRLYGPFTAGRKKLARWASTLRSARMGVQGHTDIVARTLSAARPEVGHDLAVGNGARRFCFIDASRTIFSPPRSPPRLTSRQGSRQLTPKVPLAVRHRFTTIAIKCRSKLHRQQFRLW